MRIIFSGFSWPALAALVGAALAIVLLTYRGVRRGGRRAWVLGVLLLRSLALLGLALALFQPQAAWRRAEALKGKVVLLLDGSMSMDLPSGAGHRSRQQVVQEALASTGELVRGLQRDFELRCMEFGAQALPGSVAMLDRQGSGRQPRTDLRGAMRAVAQRHGDEALRAVVLVSDGADTELPREAEARASLLEGTLEGLGVPVFAFCPAHESGIRDVSITEVRASRVAFVRARWEAEVHLAALGLGEGELTVLLRRGENVIDMQRCPTRQGGGQYVVRVGFTPTRSGTVPLMVEVEPRPEEAYRSNNYAGLVLSVVRDRIRVLQLAGRPSWDVRFLRRTLKQSPTIDLVSFFIMRDIVDDPGPATERSQVNLIPFPTAQLFTRELETFDVIIFQNFNYEVFDPGLPSFDAYLDRLRRRVTEGGAGFVMIGGDQAFDRGPYAGSPLEEILPVELRRGRGRIDEREFRARLTSAGSLHPVTRIEQDEEHNAALWDAMPQLAGCHVLPGVKQGAVVLLEHPFLSGGGRPAPIVAVREVGAGRSIAVATDETWKWNFVAAGAGLGNRAYLEFWLGALRWLVGEAGAERLSIRVQRPSVPSGERVTARVQLLGRDYAPREGAHVELRVFKSRADDAPLLREGLTMDRRGRARFEFLPDEPGFYRLEALAEGEGTETAGGQPAASAYVSVGAAGPELNDLRPDAGLLRWVAQRSGGAFYDIARGSAPKSLPLRPERRERSISQEVRPLWSNWFAYVLVVGPLCVEWWLRRRRGVS